MIHVQLDTGDVARSDPTLRTFRLAAGRPIESVHLAFDAQKAVVRAHDWRALADQLAQGSLERWKSGETDPPMGQADMHRLVSVMTGPAAFQLFQAGFDIAAAVDLVTDLPEEILCQKVTSRLRGRVDSSHGPGGLFFLQNELFTGVSANVSAELVLNNKLCRMCIEAGPQACERYYVPYTSPVGFKTTVSPKAKELWEQIRKRLYA